MINTSDLQNLNKNTKLCKFEYSVMDDVVDILLNVFNKKENTFFSNSYEKYAALDQTLGYK